MKILITLPVPLVRRLSARFLPSLLLLVIMTGAALAQSRGPVSVALVSQKVQAQADGQELRVTAEKAKPGDVLEYVATYRNTSRAGVRHLEPTLPIPAGLEYLPGSARPPPAKASVDGRVFEPLPLRRVVKFADGRVEEQLVPLAEYRALRWAFGDLAAGQSTNVVARVRVSPGVIVPVTVK